MLLELCEESCIEKSSALLSGVAGTIHVACGKLGLVLVLSSSVPKYVMARLWS